MKWKTKDQRISNYNGLRDPKAPSLSNSAPTPGSVCETEDVRMTSLCDYDGSDMDLANAQRKIDELEGENNMLRAAARLIAKRQYMVSGSVEMEKCDEYCKNLKLKPWDAKWCGLLK